jgi:hypothetical protein
VDMGDGTRARGSREVRRNLGRGIQPAGHPFMSSPNWRMSRSRA